MKIRMDMPDEDNFPRDLFPDVLSLEKRIGFIPSISEPDSKYIFNIQQNYEIIGAGGNYMNT